MRKTPLLALGLLACALLRGCRREAGEARMAEPASPISSALLNRQTAGYITLIRELDFLLGGADWHTPQEIDKTYLTMWYASYLRQHSPQGADPLAPYLREGEDGALFPQGEMEAVLEERFGLDSDHLRRDNHTYRPDQRVYATVGPAGGLRGYDIDLLSATGEDGLLTLSFTVTAGEDLPGVQRTLTLREGDPPVYLSLTTP